MYWPTLLSLRVRHLQGKESEEQQEDKVAGEVDEVADEPKLTPLMME